MKIIWSGPARRDVYRVTDLRSEDEQDAVLRLVDSVEASASVLLKHPKMGREVHPDGTRKWPVAGTPFLLFYAINGRIEIKRVRHERDDWAFDL